MRFVLLTLLPVLFILVSLLVPSDAHAMSQVIIGGYADALNSGATEYNSPNCGYVWAAGTYAWTQVISTPGKIKNLYVELSAAPGIGVGDGYRFTLMRNGVATILTCTVTQPATSASDLVNEVDVVAGDYITFRSEPLNTPSATPNAQWSMYFTGSTAGESNMLGGASGANSGTFYAGVMQGVASSYATESDAYGLVPTNGTIKNLYIVLDVSPGVNPDGYRFTLRKGGVSTALTATVTAPATTASNLVNTVAVVAGEDIDMMIEPVNGPATSPVYGSFGMTFAPTIDGESIFVAGSSDALNTGVTEYNAVDIAYPPSLPAWTNTEANVQQLAQSCTLKKLYVELSASPGVGTSYTFSMRQNSASPAGTLSVQIAGVATTGNDLVNSNTIANGDNIDLRCVPAGPPVARDAFWGVVCYITPPVPPTPAIPSYTTIRTLDCTGFDRDWAVINAEVLTTNVTSYPITNYGFRYGLTTTYTNNVNTVGTIGVGQYSSYIEDLTPGTVYHYQAQVLETGTGWIYGNDREFATKGSPARYEYWDTGGNMNQSDTFGANVPYQTFTTNMSDIPHSITHLNLYLQKTGTPTTVTAKVKNTSNCSSGPSCYCWPTGDDLMTSTLDCDLIGTTPSWYEFDMAETCLAPNTTYAIVLTALGDGANDIQWRMASAGGYSGGNAGISTDSGVSWTANCTPDMLFEVWGNPCLEVQNAKVFSSYVNSGDWLITCLYLNEYPPYFSERYDASSLFYLQLVSANGNTVIAQTLCPEWGLRPGSIYLSSSMVTALDWQAAYRVRIYGNFGANPYAEYVLQPSDWLGSDLVRLDSWVISTVRSIEDYDDAKYTDYISGKGYVLNTEGSTIFVDGVKDLDKIRPDLFLITSNSLDYETQDFEQSYLSSHIWQQMVGPAIASTLTKMGGIFSLSGSSIGAIAIFALWCVIGSLAVPSGHTIAGMALSFAIFLSGFWLGFLPLVLLGVVLSIVVVIFVWQLVFRGG